MAKARGLKTQKGPDKISNQEHIDCALAGAEIPINVPGEVITDDISAAWVNIGIDCLVRVEVAADTYIAFAQDQNGTGSSTLAAAVDVTTSPAIKLNAGYHVIRATESFIKASTNPVRIEVFF